MISFHKGCDKTVQAIGYDAHKTQQRHFSLHTLTLVWALANMCPSISVLVLAIVLPDCLIASSLPKNKQEYWSHIYDFATAD